MAGASVLDGKASIAVWKVPRIHIWTVPVATAEVNRVASLWFWKVTATTMLPQYARTTKVAGSSCKTVSRWLSMPPIACAKLASSQSASKYSSTVEMPEETPARVVDDDTSTDGVCAGSVVISSIFVGGSVGTGEGSEVTGASVRAGVRSKVAGAAVGAQVTPQHVERQLITMPRA